MRGTDEAFTENERKTVGRVGSWGKKKIYVTVKRDEALREEKKLFWNSCGHEDSKPGSIWARTFNFLNCQLKVVSMAESSS